MFDDAEMWNDFMANYPCTS